MRPKDFVFYNTIPIICILGAIYLCVCDRDGWGWLLLIAVITAVAPKSSGSDDD